VLSGLFAVAAIVLAAGPAFAEAPRRIVSLNVCADQLVLALAEPSRVVALSPFARDRAMSFLADRAAPFVTVRGGAETVLSLRPDLLLVGPIDRAAAARLVGLQGVRVMVVDLITDIESSIAQVRAVADALGARDRGEVLVAEIGRSRAALAASSLPRVIALPLERRGYAAGPGSLVGAMLREAGFALPDAAPGGFGGFVGLERIIAMRPDVLVIDTPSADGDQGNAFLGHPALTGGWPATRRLRLPQALTLCGGPSIPAALDALRFQREKLAQP
jgi:iron complex transport system substrate-binding protein